MTNRGLQSRIRRRAAKAGVVISPQLADQLERYLALLTRWNAKINLTAFDLNDPRDEALDRLVVEPLVAAKSMAGDDRSVIDIGSGSGSPAIPFHLALPETILTMVESKTRKAVFLREAARHLGLRRVHVETSRFENLLTRPELHESFDVMTIRAVRVETATLLTLQALLKSGGELLWFQAGPRDASPILKAYPLRLSRTQPLVESSGSRLSVFTKQRQGDVPRGTPFTG